MALIFPLPPSSRYAPQSIPSLMESIYVHLPRLMLSCSSGRAALNSNYNMLCGDHVHPAIAQQARCELIGIFHACSQWMVIRACDELSTCTSDIALVFDQIGIYEC